MDTIPRTQQLMVYGFLVEKFDDNAGEPAIEGLFKAFGILQRNKSAHEFVVWIGTSGPWHWWIGVPSSLPQDVTEVLREQLSTLDSFDTQELGDASEMGLLPAWKFTPNMIFALAPISGGDDIDRHDRGSGLPIEILPCIVTDEEA
jgi:hypothetical protein